MVLYFVKNYIDNGKAPREMIEDNIRIDYEKLRMLIRKDKEFAHDASVIQTLVSQGYITGELKKGFPPLEGLLHKVVEVRHLVQARQAGLERLLDGRHQYLLDAFGLDDLALGEAAVEEGQLVETYLRGLLGQPLRAVHVLGGSHGQVQVASPEGLLRQGFEDLHQAALVRGRADGGAVEVARSVGQHHFG